jgi:two-component system, chemotaxis family, sensor kinase CheA
VSATQDTDGDPRWRELAATFRVELEERLRAINRLLLKLEREGDQPAGRAEHLRALIREVHSLKAGARAVARAPIERLAHALESALDAASRGRVDLDARWFEVVYRAVDGFASIGQTAEGNGTVSELDGLLGSLRPEARWAADFDPPRSLAATPPSFASAGTPVNGQASPAERSVRVAVAKLDTLLAQAGELTVVAVRIEQRLRELAELGRGLDGEPRNKRRMPESPVRQRVEELTTRLRQDTVQLSQVTRAINDDVLAVRLLPMATIFARLERVVRDLARASGKEAGLFLEGGEVELDRRIVEQLADPLLHLLRNAVDHGIESPGQRAALGKPRAGTIRVSARPRGGLVEIEVNDDGAGLEPHVLRQRAVQQGWLPEAQAAVLDDAAAMALIFRPGFSTRTNVTQTSGRGVGMDVVRANLEGLNGHIEVSSRPGQGTCFSLTVPLTLTTTRTILATQAGRLFAIPSAAVERSARVRAHALVPIEGRRAVAIEGQPVPVVELAQLLELPSDPESDRADQRWRPFLVLRQGNRRVAVLADELVGEQEVVVKPLAWPLRRVRNVSGAAVLGSGTLAIILNPSDLLKTALELVDRQGRTPATGAAVTAPPRPRRPRLLVVDDSVITRTMERSILEAAGYEVEAVADGIEALGVLRGDAVDLVVADVEMPRMDGFALTAAIRGDERLRQIPVVLVTSLGAREHRERGVAAGADAYIVKSAFDQGQLLQTIGRLL